MKAYEIWNEPNAGLLNWHEPTCHPPVKGGGAIPCPSTGVDHAPRAATGVYGDSDLFGALTAATISTIKGDNQLGQDTPVLAPGGTVFLWEPTNESGPDFMKEAFKANPQLASLSDAVTLHGYSAYPPSSEPESAGPGLGTTNVQLGDKVAQMKATFTAAGTSPNKPVWLTEIGWPTFKDTFDPIGASDEGKQARWLIRSIVLAALNGVDRLYIYKMYDGPSVSTEDSFGLVRPDGKTVRQAYTAIQFFMRKLGGYRVQSRLPAHDPKNSVYIVQMADAQGHQAWVVWDSIEAGTGFTWKLPANTTCSGFIGGDCAVNNGELAVNSTPVYVMAR